MKPLRERQTRLVFETDTEIHYRRMRRPLIVEAMPRFAVLKLKGTQQKFVVSWEAIFHLAAKAYAEQERREKLAQRNRKAGAR